MRSPVAWAESGDLAYATDVSRNEYAEKLRTRGNSPGPDTARIERLIALRFQCGGAWPFLVDGVLCLDNPVNDRVLSLLSSVKHGTSQRDIVCLKYPFSASWQFI